MCILLSVSVYSSRRIHCFMHGHCDLNCTFSYKIMVNGSGKNFSSAYVLYCCSVYADRAITVVFASFGTAAKFSLLKVRLKFLENFPKPWTCRDLMVSSLSFLISATSRALLMICFCVYPASSNICDLFCTGITSLRLLARVEVLVCS